MVAATTVATHPSLPPPTTLSPSPLSSTFANTHTYYNCIYIKSLNCSKVILFRVCVYVYVCVFTVAVVVVVFFRGCFLLGAFVLRVCMCTRVCTCTYVCAVCVCIYAHVYQRDMQMILYVGQMEKRMTTDVRFQKLIVR